MIRLSIEYNGKHLKTYELDDGEVTVGRLPENTISIANMGISRRHFRIAPNTDRKYVVTDLNSLNGISVNSVKVREAVLTAGDVISIGKYRITFDSIGQVLPPSPRITDTDLNVVAQRDPVLDTIAEPMTDDTSDVLPPLPGLADRQTGAIDATVPVLIETSKHVVYRLDKKYMTMGSAENDDIFVAGFMVGDEHVVIERQENECWIKTMKLMGKFRVNGKKTRLHRLEHKDRIEIGSNTFRFMINQ